MRRTPMAATAAVASLVILPGCNTTSTTTASTTSSSVTPAASSTPGTRASPAATSSPAASASAEQVAITITIDGHTYPAHLNESQAARAFASRLPLTLTFRDYAQGFDEKVSDLDQALPYDQMSAGDDPNPGDIAYWSPDQRLVLYWGDVARYDGIHVIGSFDDQAATSAIQALTTSSRVTIARAN